MFRIHELLLTFFYFGKIKTAPGTMGSFISLFLWLAYTTLACGLDIPLESQNIFWGIFLVGAFAYGCFASPLYAKKFGQIDHQSIVLDEVVGQVATLQISFLLVYQTYFQDPRLMILHLTSSFFLFRFFDIKKPSFIGHADRMKSGLGVMLDDLLAGLTAALITIILLIIYFTLILY